MNIENDEKLHKVLKAFKESIIPPKELFTKIVDAIQLKEDIIEGTKSRFFMFNKWKIILPLGVVAVIAFMLINTNKPHPIDVSKETDPFELASIQKELQGVSFDSDLDSFFQEETNLEEIDAALPDL